MLFAVERQRLVDLEKGIELDESERYPEALQLFDKEHRGSQFKRAKIELPEPTSLSFLLMKYVFTI